MIKLTGISGKVRQIAVKNIGRDEPTLLISNDLIPLVGRPPPPVPVPATMKAAPLPW
jgi:hypothetical protein